MAWMLSVSENADFLGFSHNVYTEWGQKQKQKYIQRAEILQAKTPRRQIRTARLVQAVTKGCRSLNNHSLQPW